MAVAITEDMTASLQKGLSEWWSEETEYVFQRIERWAAFARGYNRLRSQRLSRGRLTMHEEQESRWSISSNKIVIEDPAWSPRFHNLKRSHRRKSRNDEDCKINCCGGFNYQSNGNIDSTCLETYRYDHSIYFKTIGDIRSSKRDLSEQCKSEIDRDSRCSDEQIEWEAKTAPDYPESRYFHDEELNERAVSEIEINNLSVDQQEDLEFDRIHQNSWSIVDLTKLNLDAANDNETSADNATSNENLEEAGEIVGIDHDDANNNCIVESSDSTQKMIQLQITQLTANQTSLNSSINSRFIRNNRDGITSFFKKERRKSRTVRQPTVVGDNNVLWPGVLLNFTKNVDPASSPHHHRAVHVK